MSVCGIMLYIISHFCWKGSDNSLLRKLRFHQSSLEKAERFLIAADERADQQNGDERAFADAVDLSADRQRQDDGQNDQRRVETDFHFAR